MVFMLQRTHSTYITVADNISEICVFEFSMNGKGEFVDL